MVLITQNLKEVKQIMTNYVGIVRSDLRLEQGHCQAGNYLPGDRGAL